MSGWVSWWMLVVGLLLEDWIDVDFCIVLCE